MTQRSWLITAATLLALATSACSDGDPRPVPADSTTKCATLDKPGTLPRPPQGRLPCELIPPGLSL